jgi:hypothetical protein
MERGRGGVRRVREREIFEVLKRFRRRSAIP